MRRREFFAGLGAVTVGWPIFAKAQQPGVPVIGFMNAGSFKGYERPYAAFIQGLGEQGYVEGRNVAIEKRWAEGKYERLPTFIAEFVQRKVKVIAATSTPAAVAIKSADVPIPGVFTTSGDPEKIGLVSSLAQPGGNLTGASQQNVEVSSKRLEIIREILPRAETVALLVNPNNPVAVAVSKDLQSAAGALRFKLHVVHASTESDLVTVFETLQRLRAEALVIGTDTFFNSATEKIASLALRDRIPAIYQYPEFTAAGGLMSYGGNVTESYRLAGDYVGRILKGAKPASLPVQLVTKIELIINLKTAKTLDLSIPLPVVNRADEVIE